MKFAVVKLLSGGAVTELNEPHNEPLAAGAAVVAPTAGAAAGAADTAAESPPAATPIRSTKCLAARASLSCVLDA